MICKNCKLEIQGRTYGPNRRFVCANCYRNVREIEFWSKVHKTPGLGPKGKCWEWTGSMSGDYGAFHYSGSEGCEASAPRVAYLLAHGKIPKATRLVNVLRHKCDNASCVRPSHLVIGTQLQNVTEMYKRGRGIILKGESHGMSKLTEILVLEIRNCLCFR